jgi:hypothetical protein
MMAPYLFSKKETHVMLWTVHAFRFSHTFVWIQEFATVSLWITAVKIVQSEETMSVKNKQFSVAEISTAVTFH